MIINRFSSNLVQISTGTSNKLLHQAIWRLFGAGAYLAPGDKLRKYSTFLYRGGGTGGPCPSEDNWKFDATTVEWTRLEECSTPRTYSAMAMLPPLNDTSIRRAVLYGGEEKSNSVLVVS